MKEKSKCCTNCKYFAYEGEYYNEHDEDWYEDYSCEKQRYDKAGLSDNCSCEEFEEQTWSWEGGN